MRNRIHPTTFRSFDESFIFRVHRILTPSPKPLLQNNEVVDKLGTVGIEFCTRRIAINSAREVSNDISSSKDSKQGSKESNNFRMFMFLITLAFAASISSAAEVPSSYGLLEKHSTFKPEISSDPIDTHAIYKKQVGPQDHHPVYRLEEHKNEGRARIEPVKPVGPVVRHDMLADEPGSTGESDRIDNPAVSNYGYGNPVEVAYPDIPYAPGYGYGPDYGANSYDLYRNNPNDYLMEPDTSTMGLLWSQVPDSRQIVSYVGRTFIWLMNSMFVLFLGSMITVGICSYTNLCSITFHGVGPIHEEMRSLITPERLEKIGHAANFVKTAIDKYQKIQKVADTVSTRRRRALFN